MFTCKQITLRGISAPWSKSYKAHNTGARNEPKSPAGAMCVL